MPLPQSRHGAGATQHCLPHLARRSTPQCRSTPGYTCQLPPAARTHKRPGKRQASMCQAIVCQSSMCNNHSLSCTDFKTHFETFAAHWQVRVAQVCAHATAVCTSEGCLCRAGLLRQPLYMALSSTVPRMYSGRQFALDSCPHQCLSQLCGPSRVAVLPIFTHRDTAVLCGDVSNAACCDGNGLVWRQRARQAAPLFSYKPVGV